jgi:soluble lytic murein transglycosylase-like protein
MSNSKLPGARTVWRIGVVALVLSTAPSFLFSQEDTFSPRAGAGELFAGVDDSLARAADALLDVSAQNTAPALAQTSVVQAPTVSPAAQNDQAPRSSVETGLTMAAMRVNLLRPAVEPILKSHGVPADLAAVILVESGGRAAALSPKGARGLWQLMPDTARRYGLRVDEIQDDRLDLFKATDAAARYLHDLHVQFGDWRLALAAYNTGEANVDSAILKAHTQDFDQLANLRLLPLETRNYVPRVLAAAQSSGEPSDLTKTQHVPTATTVFAESSR